MELCHKRYRIKSRTRFIIFVALIIILSVMLINSVLGMYNASSLTVREYMNYEIGYGDTLWNIASAYMPDSMDTRHAVYKLCLINDISAEDIYPGMIISIPIYK